MSDVQKNLSDFSNTPITKKQKPNTPPQSREELIERLKELEKIGWIQTREQFNDGLVGNTLEDFLNIKENNLSLPDAGKYELKTQRMRTSSLTTLFHFDPFPRKPKSVVVHTLGPIYGWPHQELEGEWSFRITMYGNNYTNRGFRIAIDNKADRLVVEFNPEKVNEEKNDWLQEVFQKGGRVLTPQPYWKLEDIKKKLSKKLTNTLYAKAKCRKTGKYEEFKYCEAILFEGVNFEKFKEGLTNGNVFVDFDARTGHNHGTKFRIKKGTLEDYYAKKEVIF